MKRRFAIRALAASMGTALAQVVAAQESVRLSKKELKSLIENAKTPADHQRLAAYYRAEADRLLAESRDHQEMAEMYRKNPHPMEGKHPLAVGYRHCRDIAQRLMQAAEKTKALAVMHEEMQKTA